MYETKIMELKKVPVFSLADISQIVSGKEYAKKLTRKFVRSNLIFKIKRDLYSFHNDPFLVSTFLLKPSYISSVSALSYHKLITQIPNEIFCFTPKQSKRFKFITGISFFHTKSFFGFKVQKYDSFLLPIAEPEKAIIDSIGVTPISIFEEAIERVDVNKMLLFLKKIKKRNITKRIGYLLEKNGFDVYKKLKKDINDKYIFLDPLAKKKGEKNKKWKLIINIS